MFKNKHYFNGTYNIIIMIEVPNDYMIKIKSLECEWVTIDHILVVSILLLY